MRYFLIVIAVLLTACSELHDGFSDQKLSALPNYTPTLAMKPQWFSHAGSGTHRQFLPMKPAVKSNRAYTVGNDGDVTAVDTSNGITVWQKKINEQITSGIAANSNVVVFGTTNGDVYAMRADTGDQMWRTHLPGEIMATPAINDQLTVVKTMSGDVYAFDLAKGKQQWHFQIPTPNLSLRADSSPTIAENTVLVGFATGELAAISLKSGTLLWKQHISEPHGASEVDRLVDVATTPVVRDNKVFAANYHGKLAALDFNTGQQMWHHKISTFTDIAATEKAVYVVDEDSHLWAFNATTGKVLWKQDKFKGRKLSAPVLYQDTIVVGDGAGYVHWVAKSDGEIVSRLRLDRRGIMATPVVQDSHIYVYSSGGMLAKYRKVDGSLHGHMYEMKVSTRT